MGMAERGPRWRRAEKNKIATKINLQSLTGLLRLLIEVVGDLEAGNNEEERVDAGLEGVCGGGKRDTNAGKREATMQIVCVEFGASCERKNGAASPRKM